MHIDTTDKGSWQIVEALVESNNDFERRLARFEHKLAEPDPNQLPLPLASCKCERPAHALGQQTCVRCNLPHRVPVG